MIRLNSILISVFFVASSLQAQDLFNLENSRKFANYLFDSGQYGLAIDEFERVVFMAPNDSISILNLLSAYRSEKRFEIGVKRAFDLLHKTEYLPIDFLKEVFLLQAFSGKHANNLEMVRSNRKLNSSEKQKLELSSIMLDRDWDMAQEYYDEKNNSDPFFKSMGTLLDQRQELNTKSPYLASGMSMIVPGLGKVYTKDYADGIVTFLFVVTNAYQAYRGFKEDGVKSVYGWIFGSIGAGFYLGNIYGSFKSARKHNTRIEKAYYDQVSTAIYRHL